MARHAFEDFAVRARNANPHFRDDRVLTALRDVDALIEVYYEEAAASRMPDALSWPAMSGAEIDEKQRRARRRDALHKAIIEFACVALTVLLTEARSSRANEVNIHSMLQKPAAANLEDRECWRELYLLAVFRNKIIAHHDELRSSGALGRGDEWRLLPVPPGPFAVEDDRHAKLRRIANEVGFQDAPIGHWDLLEALFRKIPAPHGSKKSDARRDVDDLIEFGGVASHTVREIDRLLDRALADAHRIVIGVPIPGV